MDALLIPQFFYVTAAVKTKRIPPVRHGGGSIMILICGALSGSGWLFIIYVNTQFKIIQKQCFGYT